MDVAGSKEYNESILRRGLDLSLFATSYLDTFTFESSLPNRVIIAG